MKITLRHMELFYAGTHLHLAASPTAQPIIFTDWYYNNIASTRESFH